MYRMPRIFGPALRATRSQDPETRGHCLGVDTWSSFIVVGFDWGTLGHLLRITSHARACIDMGILPQRAPSVLIPDSLIYPNLQGNSFKSTLAMLAGNILGVDVTGAHHLFGEGFIGARVFTLLACPAFP